MLYTTDSSENLKSFNLLNVADIFTTARTVSGSEEYYFYTEDMRGSTVNLLDETGSNVVSYWYDDFGSAAEVKASSYSDFVNEIQYTGAVYDELTGLLYLNVRFYDPSTGRFISQDTYRGERNNTDTWHLYAYCANNPINFTDESGNSFTAVILASSAIGVAYLMSAYMNTPTFKKAWNQLTSDLDDVLDGFNSKVRRYARELGAAIGASFAKSTRKYHNETELHHIVARKHRLAKPAQRILAKKDVRIDIDSYENTILIKKGLHKRLHRKTYFNMVNSVVETSYNKKGNKRRNVLMALDVLKTYIRSLDRVSPY